MADDQSKPDVSPTLSEEERHKAAVEVARVLLSESREELARADGKASLLMAAASVGVSALLGGAVSGGWTPATLARCPQVVWWCGVGLAAVGVILLAAAIYPRVSHESPKEKLTYFGHISRFRDTKDLREALLALENDPLERLVDQVSAISAITWFKYRMVRLSLWALAGGSTLCVGSVIWNRWA